MSDNNGKGWRKLFEDIFVFEMACYLFDLFMRVIREFFNLLLLTIFVVMILIAIKHLLN